MYCWFVESDFSSMLKSSIEYGKLFDIVIGIVCMFAASMLISFGAFIVGVLVWRISTILGSSVDGGSSDSQIFDSGGLVIALPQLDLQVLICSPFSHCPQFVHIHFGMQMLYPELPPPPDGDGEGQVVVMSLVR